MYILDECIEELNKILLLILGCAVQVHIFIFSGLKYYTDCVI